MEDFYGSKGYIEVAQGQALRVLRVPNVEAGTMDLEFQIDEGQKSQVEKIEHPRQPEDQGQGAPPRTGHLPRGNVRHGAGENQQAAARRACNILTRWTCSREPTDPPISGRKNLVINVEEQNTGNLTFGAGFSSVDSLVGFVEMRQANFDLFHPPYFTGAGQQLTIRVATGHATAGL